VSDRLVLTLRERDCGEVAGDRGRRAQYSADASNYRRVPRAVVFARTREEVLNAVRVCRELDVPITCRGAGTSTSGQAVGSGVVLDFSRFPDLLDADPIARRVADLTRTFAELLVRDSPGWAAPRIDAASLSQTHCHQHATARFVADAALLASAGVDNQVLDSGCCGLAGNFGFEPGHFDVSVAAGEQVLLPAVRAAAPSTVVLADGFSCRTQIAQGTDRTATHIAELIASRLPAAETDTDTTSKGH
jgi:hypothetical protein